MQQSVRDCLTKLAKHFAAAVILATLAAALVSMEASAEEPILSRNGGPSENAMLARGDGGIEGFAFFRPVLSGVLYRAGFHGGDKSRSGLNSSQRSQLCAAGFSQARYVDFGKNTSYGATPCANGSLNYEGARSNVPSEVMQAVYDVIKDPDEGALLVHCMWGVHASGAVSAMALVQFCGWSEERAKAYWNEARNGADCSGGCDNWIDTKFTGFEIDPTLAITEEERAAICPQ